MSIFKRIFNAGNKPGSYAYRLKKANELHGTAIKYVTERRDGNDDVVGRGGSLTVHEDTFIVDSSGDRLFVCKISELNVATLMSGNGVVISGPNMLEDGKPREIIAHFVYHRK